MKSWKNLIVHTDSMHPEHGEKKFPCDKCPKSFIFEKSCEIHKYNHMMTEQNAGKTFKCKKCEYSTISKRGYTLHKINNHDSGSLKQCPHCDHKVLTKQNLNRHIETNHSDRYVKKRHVCEKCAKLFIFKSSLTDHVWKNKSCNKKQGIKKQ